MVLHRTGRRLAGYLAVFALLLTHSETSAQSNGLTPGQVVRIDRDFVGTVMSVTDETTVTVMGSGAPKCYAGINHGDPPRCDPAPAIRRVVDWTESTIEVERERSYLLPTLLGFVAGAAALSPVGYVTGPSLGYGRIDACVQYSLTRNCSDDSITQEEFDRLQSAQDQKRGAFFFGVLGGTAGAIIARRLVDSWLELSPPTRDAAGTWSFGVAIPAGQR